MKIKVLNYFDQKILRKMLLMHNGCVSIYAKNLD